MMYLEIVISKIKIWEQKLKFKFSMGQKDYDLISSIDIISEIKTKKC